MPIIFGDCELDIDRRELKRQGQIVHIRSKVFLILEYLIKHRDSVVTREDLLKHGWPGLEVSDATLSSCILSVRRAIGDDVANPLFIKTLRGQGFRFIADVTNPQESETESQIRVDQSVYISGDNPSIAILPFANLSKDPEIDYLADGIAEDITTEMSRFKAFSVIARNSSFQYRGLANDIEKIGAELKVNYILEGSIRSVGGVFRTTVQLVHAPSTRHIWAENYDGDIDQILGLQDEVTRKIVSSIAPEMALEEFRRSSKPAPGQPQALEMAWRSRSMLERARSESDAEMYRQGMTLAEDAVNVDPTCLHAWWAVSFGNYVLAFGGTTNHGEALLTRAREAAEKMRSLDRHDHRGDLSLGWISYIERDVASAWGHLQHAHGLNPNCNVTLTMMGIIATSAGKAERGYEFIQRAIRLSPRDLWLGFMVGGQAFSCFALEKYTEGAECSRHAVQLSQRAPLNNVILAACLVESGDMEGAIEAIRQQRQISQRILDQYVQRKRLPFNDPVIAERYAAALERACVAADAA